MTKLILHIGTEKTGTTSIQRFLKANQRSLRNIGIYVPLSLMDGTGNHRWLPLRGYSPLFIDDFVRLQGLVDLSDREKEVSNRKQRFARKINASATRCNTFVLSSEHLHSRLRSKDDISRLRDFLCQFFEDITIVVYIRDPLRTAISFLSTSIRQGGRSNFLPDPSGAYVNNLCNHASSIHRWRGCFPGARMIVRRFEPNKLIRQCVVSDFSSQCLAVHAARMNLWLPPNENQKLSLTGMKLLRLINQKFPAPILPRMLIVHFVAQITNDGTSFLPSLQEQTVYRSLFSESNEAVRRDYFPAEDALFEELNTVSEEQINLQDFVPDRSFYVGLLRSLWNRCGKYVINR